MNPQSDNIQDYLNPCKYIDSDDSFIQEKAADLAAVSSGKSELIENTYHFVQNQIIHSYFTADKKITLTASEALREGSGICFSKANLLAALLRANDIPTGICYQRFNFLDGGEQKYSIHALNAVYLGGIIKWIRLDTRSTQLTVNNEVALDKMMFNLSTRDETDIDFDQIYCEPAPMIMEKLEANRYPFVESEEQQ